MVLETVLTPNQHYWIFLERSKSASQIPSDTLEWLEIHISPYMRYILTLYSDMWVAGYMDRDVHYTWTRQGHQATTTAV